MHEVGLAVRVSLVQTMPRDYPRHDQKHDVDEGLKGWVEVKKSEHNGTVPAPPKSGKRRISERHMLLKTRGRALTAPS